MSTPMETNTEELREVLQQVYNLPDRSSGGSSEPDLVIGLQIPSDHALTENQLSYMTFSVKSGSAANTFNKLKNREEVKVFIEHEYWYSDNKFTGVFYPSVVTAADIWDGRQGVALEFQTTARPGFGYGIEGISVCVLTDGSVGAAYVNYVG